MSEGVRLLPQGRDALGRRFAGPVIAEPERDCLACLRLRLASVGARITAMGPAPPGLNHLADHAALADGGTLALYPSLPLPPCRCPRALRQAGRCHPPLAAVSPLFGPVREVRTCRAEDGGTLAIVSGARILGSSGLPAAIVGSATDADPQAAATRAVIEALERYSAAFWDAALLVSGQVAAADVVSGARCLVAAERIYLPFRDIHGADASGLAAGCGLADARERALAERIERDLALPILRRQRPPEGTPQRNAAGFDLLLGRQSGFQVWLSALVRDRMPWLSIGLGSARDPSLARAKAHAEAGHVRASMQFLAAQDNRPPPTDRLQLDGIVYRLASDPARAARMAAFLSTGGSTGGGASLPEPRYAFVEVTTPDVALFGLSVVRVVTCGADGYSSRK